MDFTDVRKAASNCAAFPPKMARSSGRSRWRREMGGGFDVMKKIKRVLDPYNIMNPGKYLLDQAYEGSDEP